MNITTPTTGPIIAKIDTASVPSPAADPLDASFDIALRQDRADAAITELRTDVDEVKARIDRVGRAAARPVIGGTQTASDSTEVKGFVDGYLRGGRTNEIKSVNGQVPTEGGYAVPRHIDAMIARRAGGNQPDPIARPGGADRHRRLSQAGQHRRLTTAAGSAKRRPAPKPTRPDFQEIAPPTGELYANPAASQAMLDDAAFDLESWLASRDRDGIRPCRRGGVRQRYGHRPADGLPVRAGIGRFRRRIERSARCNISARATMRASARIPMRS